MRIVMLGAPGSGKGTQDSACNRSTNCRRSRRAICCAVPWPTRRRSVSRPSHYGRGELVSDEIVLGMIRSASAKPERGKRGFILDGFPRNLRAGR